MSFEDRLKFRCETDVGVERQENQDNLGTFSPDQVGMGWLFVVADGMGGAAGGRLASTIAVARIMETYRDTIKADSTVGAFDAIRAGIMAAGAGIKEKIASDPSLHGMGTTAVVMAIIGDLVYTAHVGDSRIYRYRDGRLEQLTRDHTRVQFLVDQGIITPAEARKHPDGHIIVRNLGGSREPEVDIPDDGPFRIRDGDVFLLCSDGLYGLMSDESIRQVISYAPPDAAAPALIDLANRRGGHDNITVSLVCAGTPPDTWENFDPKILSRMLDTLALDNTSDTALFEAYDPDALSPSDFETSRLEAVSQELEVVPRDTPPNAPSPQAAAAPAAAPAPTSGSLPEADLSASSAQSVAPSPKKKSRVGLLLVVLVLCLVFVGGAVGVGWYFFGNQIRDAVMGPDKPKKKKKNKSKKKKSKEKGELLDIDNLNRGLACVDVVADRNGIN